VADCDLRPSLQNDRKEITKLESTMCDADKIGYREALKAFNDMSSSLESVEKTDRLQSVSSIGMGIFRDFQVCLQALILSKLLYQKYLIL
jgi:DNA polymerase/3'-5' exonuclease PolX